MASSDRANVRSLLQDLIGLIDRLEHPAGGSGEPEIIIRGGDLRLGSPGVTPEFELFRRICKDVTSKIVHFEYNFRFLGEGGPLMTSFRDLRKSLDALLGFYEDLVDSEYVNQPQLMMSITLSTLSKTLDGAITAFEGFADFIYDRNFLDALYDLQEWLSHRPEDPSGDKSTDHNHSNIAKIDPEEFRRRALTHLPVLTERLRNLSFALHGFIDVAIPLIRSAQAQETSKHLTVTTVATFFSAVTATTIQFSYESNDTHANNFVNVMWFSSLVFSIASAISSLLVMTWRQSFVRSPLRHMPHIVSTWLINGPMTYLIVSGAMFISGLCVFVYSSKQCYLASCLTTVFAFLHAVGLLVLSVWFVLEKWRFRSTSGIIGRALTASSWLLSLMDWLVRTTNPLQASLNYKSPDYMWDLSNNNTVPAAIRTPPPLPPLPVHLSRPASSPTTIPPQSPALTTVPLSLQLPTAMPPPATVKSSPLGTKSPPSLLPTTSSPVPTSMSPAILPRARHPLETAEPPAMAPSTTVMAGSLPADILSSSPPPTTTSSPSTVPLRRTRRLLLGKFSLVEKAKPSSSSTSPPNTALPPLPTATPPASTPPPSPPLTTTMIPPSPSPSLSTVPPLPPLSPRSPLSPPAGTRSPSRREKLKRLRASPYSINT